MYNILVSDPVSEKGLAPLVGDDNLNVTMENAANAGDLSQYDALIVRSQTTVDAALLEQLTNVKIIARAGVGTDNIDVDKATEQGIVVVNAPDGNTISTAEHTFAMLMAASRNIPQANASIKNEEWNRKAFQGRELRHKTLGIVGFGRIGAELSKRAKAFEMDLLVYDPFLTKARAEKLGVESVELDEVLKQADYITVHTPLTKDTQGLLGMENIGKTKPGVFLLNCARGGIVDEEALKHYLDNEHISGAALDVFEEEPVTNTELACHPNVIATPHIAASTQEAQMNVAVQVAEEVRNFLNGQPALNSINLPAMSKERYAEVQPFYDLTRKMGNILSQCMKSPAQEIEVNYGGDVADVETSILTRSLVAGFLGSRIDAPVNDVNASLTAKERGITYGEKQLHNAYGYANIVHAVVHGDHGSFSLQGTYVKEYGPRIVNINGFNVDFFPTGHLIYIQHSDQPGVIGKMGQLLGEEGVNIATMQVGRQTEGGDAIMMLAVDREPTEHVVQVLTSIDEIYKADKIEV
ncbi:phosphoglycerate dehydrogenase [Salsuginibacillus halophilus]